MKIGGEDSSCEEVYTEIPVGTEIIDESTVKGKSLFIKRNKNYRSALTPTTRYPFKLKRKFVRGYKRSTPPKTMSCVPIM
jgi:hypothetical protein